MLGDVGGLFDALCGIATIVLFLLSKLTNSGPHNYIIKRVFKTQLGHKSSKSSENALISELRSRKPLVVQSLKCLWLTNTKKNRILNLARESYEREFDIIHFINLQKSFQNLNKMLYSKVERYLLKNHRSFVIKSN